MVNRVIRGVYKDISDLIAAACSPEEADALLIDLGAPKFHAAMLSHGAYDGVTFKDADPGKYSRTLLQGSVEDLPSILSMLWRGGAPPHRHAGRACMDVVVEGEMAVTTYFGEHVEGDIYRLDEGSTTIARPGDLVLTDPRTSEIHGVRLLSDMAKTIHLYPIRAGVGQFFERRADGLYVQKECVLTAHEP